MTYLFLDFDGVLHPSSANGKYFRPENINPVEQAISGLDIKIIISSTWRFDKTLEEIKNILGNELGNLVIGSTPDIDDPFVHYPRQLEVHLYLEKHDLTNSAWVAIDDTPAFYKPEAPLLLTDPQTGFTAKDIEPFRDLVFRVTEK